MSMGRRRAPYCRLVAYHGLHDVREVDESWDPTLEAQSGFRSEAASRLPLRVTAAHAGRPSRGTTTR